MIIIISVTISFTTCGLGMRIRLHFEQRQHLLFLHKNHINRAIFCSVTTCCRLLLSIWTWFCCSFVSSGLGWPAAKQHSASELRLFLFLHKEASLGGIRRSIAIAGLWGWLIWMLKQQTVFIQFMRMSHSSVWSKHILNLWPLIISIERKVQENWIKLRKILIIAKCNAGFLACFAFQIFTRNLIGRLKQRQ